MVENYASTFFREKYFGDKLDRGDLLETIWYAGIYFHLTRQRYMA